MTTPPFQPGFRISAMDIAVLIVGGAGAVFAAEAEWWLGVIVGFAVGHFFLFCNVFRVARPLELAWAGLYVVLAGSTIVMNQPGWPITLATSLVATLLVVGVQLRQPSYHGVGWHWINPELPQWWEAHAGGRGAERP
jgi:hypothetical protein